MCTLQCVQSCSIHAPTVIIKKLSELPSSYERQATPHMDSDRDSPPTSKPGDAASKQCIRNTTWRSVRDCDGDWKISTWLVNTTDWVLRTSTGACRQSANSLLASAVTVLSLCCLCHSRLRATEYANRCFLCHKGLCTCRGSKLPVKSYSWKSCRCATLHISNWYK